MRVNGIETSGFFIWLLLIIPKEAMSEVFPQLYHVFDILEIHVQYFTNSLFNFLAKFANGILFCF